MLLRSVASRCVCAPSFALLCALAACADDDGEASSAGASGGAGSAGKAGKGAAGAGAGSDAAAGQDAGMGDTTAVSIRFAAKIGRQAFACGRSYAQQGTTAASVTPQDLRFFVQDVSLVTREGREVPVQLDARDPFQTAQLALLDFEDGSGGCAGDARENDTITGQVPAGEYTAIRFTNGVPVKLNHGDPKQYPAPLKTPGMSWNWLLGFRFLKAELATETAADPDAGLPAGVAFHLGSTACSGNPAAGDITCNKPNRNRIELAGYELGRSVIVLDVAELFRQTDLSQLEECHSAMPSCSSMFASVGVDYATGAAAETQTAYHLEAAP